MSLLFASGVWSIGASASASVLPMNVQGWFPLGWIGWIPLLSKGLSRVFSSTTIKKHRHHFANKGLYSQSYGFPNSCGWIWELDHREGWVLKTWCFWIVVLEKTLESSLNSKKIKAVNPKGNQSWIFMEGLMLKLKLQYFGHLMWRADLLEETLMLGKTEDRTRREQQKMRWLDAITDSMDMILSKLRDGEGQGSLPCCSPWGFKESDTT